MLKKTTSLLIIILLVSFSLIAFSHPASKIEAKFIIKEKVLVVKVLHNTADVTKHFIDKIEVLLNGASVAKLALTK